MVSVLSQKLSILHHHTLEIDQRKTEIEMRILKFSIAVGGEEKHPRTDLVNELVI